MIGSIAAFVLIAIGLLALALQRFYSSVPAKELKRLAARGDHLAAALYRPVAFGASMRLLLWMVFGAAVAGGFLLLMYNFSSLVAFVAVAISMAAIVLLQSVRLNVHSVRVAVWVAPALHGVMLYAHKPLSLFTRLVNRYREHAPHSGLYEKEDLVALLRQQREQVDNRMSQAELELLERAVQLDDKKAADIVLPWQQMKLVSVSDHIGPVLLGELHETGQPSFVVYDGKPNQVVGTLFLRDAVHAKSAASVRELMHPHICYVHEDFSLRQVLGAFAASGQFMVVVVNAFEEAVGVITLQHMLAQLIGTVEQEDIAYEDRHAVAAWRPQLQPAEVPVADGPQQQASPEPTEVVE